MCPGHVFYGKAPFRNPQDSCHEVRFSSVSQSCPTLCDQVDCSMTGFPVHCHSRSLLKLALVHKASDAIQPSRRPLLLPPSIVPSSRVFSYELILCIRWPKYCSFSFNISPSMNIQTGLLWDGPAGSPCSPRASAESSPPPQFKSIHSSALSFLYSPTLTSMHDYWINHILD